MTNIVKTFFNANGFFVHSLLAKKHVEGALLMSNGYIKLH